MTAAPPPRRLVTSAEWDHVILVIGKRNHGKTAWTLDRVLDLSAAAGGAYIIAHDPGHRIKPWTPRRGNLRAGALQRHRSVDELAAALRLPQPPDAVHTVATPDAEPVMLFALELGRASLRTHGGQGGVPVVAWVNEVTACAVASPQRFGGVVNQLAAQGRHDLVALVVEAQSSRLINFTLLSNVTRATFFRLTDRRALLRLEEFDVPPEILRRLPSLARYKHIEWDPSKD